MYSDVDIVVVSNTADIIAYYVYRLSRSDKSHVIGMEHL